MLMASYPITLSLSLSLYLSPSSLYLPASLSLCLPPFPSLHLSIYLYLSIYLSDLVEDGALADVDGLLAIRLDRDGARVLPGRALLRTDTVC